ncbi:YbfB/YjiJ family MFS transporter [Vibrio profundum]|uniref:YbfB/YjiJ family MFS transporter n=1 Tax=Vibrio profundum TaxID=2910247 RepID=UPI003D116DAC
MLAKINKTKVLVAGISSLVLSVGIARFAYTPMLSIMQQQTGLSQSMGALLASINYIGYFLGVLLTASIRDIRVKHTCYCIGMVLAVVTTFSMGLTSNVWLWSGLRLLSGLSSAAGVLMSSGLILNWLISNKKNAQLGFHFCGIGLGIVVAASLPSLTYQILDWKQLWYVYGALSVLLLIPALAWLPRPASQQFKVNDGQVDSSPSAKFLRYMKLGYFCAGVGYVVSATFIVAIVNSALGSSNEGNAVFILLGLAAMFAPIWDKISMKMGRLNALILACLLQTLGVLLPTLSTNIAVLLVSAVLFGNTFIAIVNLVMTMSGQYYPSNPAKMMAKMTISYAFAQIIAPIGIAIMVAHHLSYLDGLYFAGAIMIAGTLSMIKLKSLEKPSSAVHA